MPKWFIIGRDVACLLVGLTGIIWQEFSNDVNALLLGVYLCLIGTPAATNAIWLFTRSPTELSPPSPPQPSSSEQSLPS